jgi:hypothetical protein
VLVAISLASTSVGLAVALAVVVDILVARRRWSDLWIPVAPLALYALWTIAYQTATSTTSVSSTVEFVAESAAVSMSALLGLSGTNPLNSTGTLLVFGVPLALAAIALVVWSAPRRGPFAARAWTLLSLLGAFWVLTGLTRSDISGPYASRYLYVDGVFMVLLAAELARGASLSLRLRLVLVVIALAAVVSNVGVLRGGAGFLRAEAQLAKADLAALDLSRQYATRSYIATSFPGFPFVSLRAVDLYATEHALGSPADSVAQLRSAAEPARETADAEMANIRGMVLHPGGARPAGGGAPRAIRVVGGSLTSGSSCVTFAAGATAPGQPNQLQLTIPPRGVWMFAGRSSAAVGVRRFASGFHPAGTLPAGAAARLSVPADSVAQPWQLQVQSTGSVIVCGLAG